MLYIGGMDAQELIELPEHVHADQRWVGISTAVMAALLAMVTLMGHRLHTEEVVLQTRTADGWAYYQAKNTRAQMYAADAALAALTTPQGALVAQWTDRAAKERQDADEVRREGERLDRDTQRTARRATMFDAAEAGLELAIVLCSVALLTGANGFWQLSFVPTLISIGVAAFGFIRP